MIGRKFCGSIGQGPGFENLVDLIFDAGLVKKIWILDGQTHQLLRIMMTHLEHLILVSLPINTHLYYQSYGSGDQFYMRLLVYKA